MRKGWTEGSLESYKKSMAETRARKKANGTLTRKSITVFTLSKDGADVISGNEMLIRRFLGLVEKHNDLLWYYVRENKQIQGYDIRISYTNYGQCKKEK